MDITIPHLRYLVLLLTNRCNLSCKYCYCPEKKANLDMSSETIKRAIHIAASHGKPFHVQLSGGEPCLAADAIFAAVKEIRLNALQATVAIQTNATMLDNTFLAFFKENRVEVGVSIDGPPLTHEKNRGKFDLTFKGLELLEKHNVPWHATAVVTDDSVEQLWRLVLLISKFRTACGIGLDFITRKSKAMHNGIFPATPQKVKRGITKMLETLEWVNRSSKRTISLREADAVARHVKTMQKKNFCHVCNAESMAVYPDGSLYPCSQLCGEKKYYAGNINGIVDWTRLRVDGPVLGGKECELCSLNGICPGDCPSRILINCQDDMHCVCALYQTIYAYQNKGLL